ncbi:MAG: alpha/beta hydrolase [Planctomycetes bacterium]|nr:alpha/beta hydrolase [Planctomycetota bacterium]
MKKPPLLAALFLTVAVAHGADATALRETVWNRYLSPGEQAALAALTPVPMDATAAPEAEPDPATVLAATRTGFAAMAAAHARAAPAVTVTPWDRDGVKGCWLDPDGANRHQVVLYLHGGAYCFGSAETPQAITAFLATAAAMRCFSLDYPLAPEHPFPAAVDNALAAYRMLLADGFAPGAIALAGDSAGGGLALALLQRIREADLPMPAGAYLLSPWTDLSLGGRSHAHKAAVDAAVPLDLLTTAAAAYSRDHDLRDPLLSPVFADPRGFPPLLVQVGSHERLLMDAVTLVANAAEADVPVTLSVWPGYPHVFQFYHRDLEGGRIALQQAAEFLRQTLTGPGRQEEDTRRR